MSELVYPLDMKFVPKSWGSEIWIVNNNLYCGKKLNIDKGKHCSFHYHKIKDEFLYVESGKILMIYDNFNELSVLEMPAGFGFRVMPYLKHQMYALEDSVILEFSTFHSDSDSYRIQTELCNIDPLLLENK
jgi:uncharacterized RmlC-like cupin family protein